MQISKIPKGFNNIPSLERKLKTEPEEYWIKRGENRAVKLFKLMSQRVPAYKDFLKKSKIDPDLIKGISDFKHIPTIDKNNYLRAYPLESLCWDGVLSGGRYTIATNSGSTGEPFYFPREIEQDRQYAVLAELYLRNNFEIHKNSTLYLDCFAMGAWIGGVFTYEAIRMVAENGKYPLTIYTPGIFKDEIFKAVENLSPKFDQTIIGGYPPFIKNLIDEGLGDVVKSKKIRLGYVFSAEGFTEEFREYIFRKSGNKDYFKSSLNHYGTADMGTMANETPTSILVRKIVNNNNELIRVLFPEKNRLPTLAQYFPELFYFESINDVLCCSGYSGLPLIRYNLKDYGNVFKYGELIDRFKNANIDLDKVLNSHALTSWKLPFVFLYERKDFVVKLYGANIFPDTIRHALQQRFFENDITSKFLMRIKYDKVQDQYLEINIELKKGVCSSKKLENKISSEVVGQLLKENSEFASNYKSLREKQIPKIILLPYEYPEMFNSGGKHKWIMN